MEKKLVRAGRTQFKIVQPQGFGPDFSGVKSVAVERFRFSIRLKTEGVRGGAPARPSPNCTGGSVRGTAPPDGPPQKILYIFTVLRYASVGCQEADTVLGEILL